MPPTHSSGLWAAADVCWLWGGGVGGARRGRGGVGEGCRSASRGIPGRGRGTERAQMHPDTRTHRCIGGGWGEVRESRLEVTQTLADGGGKRKGRRAPEANLQGWEEGPLGAQRHGPGTGAHEEVTGSGVGRGRVSAPRPSPGVRPRCRNLDYARGSGEERVRAPLWPKAARCPSTDERRSTTRSTRWSVSQPGAGRTW